MRGQHHRSAVCARQRAQEPHDLASGAAIEVSRGLVGKHERRLVDQRPGNGAALALAPGQMGHAAGLEPGETHSLEERLRPRPRLEPGSGRRSGRAA